MRYTERKLSNEKDFRYDFKSGRALCRRYAVYDSSAGILVSSGKNHWNAGELGTGRVSSGLCMADLYWLRYYCKKWKPDSD